MNRLKDQLKNPVKDPEKTVDSDPVDSHFHYSPGPHFNKNRYHPGQKNREQ